jgi:TonB family protein
MTTVMADRYPNAVLASSLIHGAVIALLLLMTYVVHRQVKESPHIFELVAGEGDNYGAKEAPALGVAGGLKVPATEAPKPADPAPVESAAPVPAPLEAVVPPKPKPADPAAKIGALVRNIEKKSDRVVKKVQADAEKQRQLTKEQFDQQNKGKAAVMSKNSATGMKITKVDSEGIAKGVVGGSTANTTGGAGGKALVREDGDVLAAYDSLFKQRLKAAFEPPPGLSDTLVATVEVRSNSDGTLSRARITKSSGSAEFDRAVLDAIAHTQMPARPDGRSETISFPFTMREKDAE